MRESISRGLKGFHLFFPDDSTGCGVVRIRLSRGYLDEGCCKNIVILYLDRYLFQYKPKFHF